MVERRRRALRTRRITAPRAIAINKDYAAQDPLIINEQLAMGLRNEQFLPLHLIKRQPE